MACRPPRSFSWSSPSAPDRRSSLRRCVPYRQRWSPNAGVPWLVARRSIASEAATIIGPILGGLLYVAGVWVALVAVAALSVIGAAAILAIRIPDEERLRTSELSPVGDDEVGHVLEEGIPASRGGLHEALEGLRFVRATPVLLGAISLDLFAVLFGGAVTLLPAIAVRLHVGPVGLGWLRASVGLGAGATTLLISFRPIERRVGRVLLTAVAVLRRVDHRPRPRPFVRAGLRRHVRPVRGRRGQRLHPLHSRPSGDTTRDARQGPRRRERLYRRLQPAWWVRIRRTRPIARHHAGRSSLAASPRWSWRSPGAYSSPRSGGSIGSRPHLLPWPQARMDARVQETDPLSTARRPHEVVVTSRTFVVLPLHEKC